MKYFYFALLIFGLIIPYTQFMPFYLVHGMDIHVMISEVFATRITSFFGLDLIISAMVAIPFMIHEGRKIDLKHYWIAPVCVVGIGLSFALPLFLFLRENHLES